ncbi:MAG: transposase [Burkholderiales bacterium]
MAEAKKRKVHGAEFKAKVGLEAVRGVKTINEIAQQHGVHPVMVSQWKKEIVERAGTLFEGKRGPKAEAAREDEDRLFGEIGRLKMELDWLKKSQACERRGAAGMDRTRRRAAAGPPVRTGRGFEGDGVSPSRGRPAGR